MFGYITVKQETAVKSRFRRLFRRLRRGNVVIEEKTVCGMRLICCTVHIPEDMGQKQAEKYIRRTGLRLYAAGVRRAAVPSGFPYMEILERIGIRRADSAALYEGMYPALLERLQTLRELPKGEGHLIVYTTHPDRGVYSFCRQAVGSVRYLTVVGPGLCEDLRTRLLDEYGVASCSANEDGSYVGDYLVCFDPLTDRVRPFASRFSVYGAILPWKSQEEMCLDAFVKINGADFQSRHFAPFATGDPQTDIALLSFLRMGGFLKPGEIEIDRLTYGNYQILPGNT